MIAALIIVFREVFEAGLIIGIVLAVTRTVPHRNQWIAGGVLAGVLAACLVAVFAGALSNLFAGMGQELFNALILAIAVVMLTWHNVWMARHGKELAGELPRGGEGGGRGLEVAAGAGGRGRRRGAARGQRGRAVPLWRHRRRKRQRSSVALGGFAGLLLGALVCVLTYAAWSYSNAHAVCDHHRPYRAAGRRHGGAGGGVPGKGQLADRDGQRGVGFGWLLSDSSLLGKALHTLIGYTDQPTAMQLSVYLAVLAVTFVLMRLVRCAGEDGYLSAAE